MEIKIQPGPDNEMFDYTCNIPLIISQILKNRGKDIKPLEIAQKLCLYEYHMTKKVDIMKEEYLVISLDKIYVGRELTSIVNFGVLPPNVGSKKKVIIQFGILDIAKEMHAGHLRSAIIAESLGRLLEFVKFNVVRLDNKKDYGTQVGMLIAYPQDKYSSFPEETVSIQDIQTFYKESKIRFDEDPDFRNRAYSCLVKLQQHDPVINKGWKQIYDICRNEHQKIYERLDVSLINRGEYFYYNIMNEIVEELQNKGCLIEEEGRKVMFSNNFPVPLTIVKSDHGFTYDTLYMAEIKHHIIEEQADWILYVADSGQSHHFETIFSCAKDAGWYDPEKVHLKHLEFGDVVDEDKSGLNVCLTVILNEALERALEKLKEKGRDKELNNEELKLAQEIIAYGCIKYDDLSHNRNHKYTFSFDRMFDDTGNTAIYLLYALTRIRSIAQTANINQAQLKLIAKTSKIIINHPKEWKLSKMLFRFPDIIISMMEDLCMHTLCDYLFELSAAFEEFYDSCYCIEKDRETGKIININKSRIMLCEVTAAIMTKGFQILGIRTDDKI